MIFDGVAYLALIGLVACILELIIPVDKVNEKEYTVDGIYSPKNWRR
jgi:hypothetical protein